MTLPPDLLKAIRSGRLEDVRAAFQAGAALATDGGPGEPCLEMGIACFLGHPEIIRELVLHGAAVNAPDNMQPTSPLSMAIRGKHPEAVRVLIELGALVPGAMQTGLGEHEITVAQWVAFRDGYLTENGKAAAEAPVFEEIEVHRCSNVDTQVLEAELLRQVIANKP